MRDERVKIQLIPLKANYFRSTFVDCIYVFDCHLSGVVSRNRRCVFYGIGAKLRYVGYFASLLHPHEEKNLVTIFSQGHVFGP